MSKQEDKELDALLWKVRYCADIVAYVHLSSRLVCLPKRAPLYNGEVG